MKLNLDDITFIIVTYKSENIIQNCLNSLPKNSKKIIIENSNNINLEYFNILIWKDKNKDCTICVSLCFRQIV